MNRTEIYKDIVDACAEAVIDNNRQVLLEEMGQDDLYDEIHSAMGNHLDRMTTYYDESKKLFDLFCDNINDCFFGEEDYCLTKPRSWSDAGYNALYIYCMDQVIYEDVEDEIMRQVK